VANMAVASDPANARPPPFYAGRMSKTGSGCGVGKTDGTGSELGVGDGAVLCGKPQVVGIGGGISDRLARIRTGKANSMSRVGRCCGWCFQSSKLKLARGRKVS
jgi:hypothetical protein